jgi:hypothetical protein
LERLAVAQVDIDQLDPVRIWMGARRQYPGDDDAWKWGSYNLGPFHHQAKERKGACDLRRSALDGREVT